MRQHHEQHTGLLECPTFLVADLSLSAGLAKILQQSVEAFA